MFDSFATFYAVANIKNRAGADLVAYYLAGAARTQVALRYAASVMLRTYLRFAIRLCDDDLAVRYIVL